MDEDLVRQWVPDGLWEVAAPLVPPVRPRPQGGGTAVIDSRAVLAAIVSVLTTGCAWRHLPPGLGVAVPTAHRRCAGWTRAGFWRRLHTAALDQLWCPRPGRLVAGDRRRRLRASDKGGELTGASPVDRSKPGSKVHGLSDRGGLPLAVTVSAAHTHDSPCREAFVQAIPAVCSRRGRHRRRPDKLHLDTGYDYPHLRALLGDRDITPWVARRGGESSTRLGRYRWVIERTIAGIFGYRRLTIRYERSAKAYCTFLTLAAALTCHKRHLKHAT